MNNIKERIGSYRNKISEYNYANRQKQTIIEECQKSLLDIIDNSDEFVLSRIKLFNSDLVNKEYIMNMNSLSYEEVMELQERINTTVVELLNLVEEYLK
ncbi:hypothetical protein D3C81_980440 [compost metagenome]